MSWLFDEVDDYVTLADDAALTFPDGDWTVAGWIRLTDNTGSAFQYFLSWGAFNTSDSWHWYIGEASHGVIPNKLNFYANTTAGGSLNDGVDHVSGVNVGSSTSWQHVVVRHTQSTKTLQYFIDGVADTSWSYSGATGPINNSGALVFGKRDVSPTDRYYGGRLAEFANGIVR
ncbi:MAG: hypothetical protein IPI21_13700 [Propionivibrio sp.]|nr:hypothetical protein [Propionivibrio sp.]